MKLLLISVLFLTGCASSPYLLPESDSESRAPGDAFAGASMYLRKTMPDHRGDRARTFYYKHCDTSGEEVYFSKTAYDCTGPD